MFKKQDGGIDMVSLILTVVIAAVTMMVGLEDKLVTSYDPSNRGRQHGVIHAKHHQIGTVNLPYKRAEQHGNCIWSGKQQSNVKNDTRIEKFLSKSLFLDVKSYIRAQFPRVGIVRFGGSLHHRDCSGSSRQGRLIFSQPLTV
jgi:hypothetical protein